MGPTVNDHGYVPIRNGSTVHINSDSMLLDGTHFSVVLKFSDGTTVSASGYGEFPENYGHVAKTIDALFLPLLPQELRDW